MAALAITAVCGGCHNVRETVEEAAAHANVSYELKDSEKEIISATNDFSFKLFQSLADNNKDKDFIISPLGVVYSLDIISNGNTSDYFSPYSYLNIISNNRTRATCRSFISNTIVTM